ncbi:MAG: hypothetical protein HY747_11375 [Elusimicrobia bacterium]|nr:hypothetical protein [Elusimicrobiota bacterium]
MTHHFPTLITLVTLVTLVAFSKTAAGQANPDETAGRVSVIFDGKSAKETKTVAVKSSSVPGDNFEERVEQEYQDYRRLILIERAKTYREEANKQWIGAAIDGAMVAASATGLGLSYTVLPELLGIFGYVSAGLLAVFAGYKIYDLAKNWETMSTTAKVLNFIAIGLYLTMGVLAVLNPASWGLGALITLGAHGLISGIINIVGGARDGSEADKAQQEADAIAANNQS